GAKKIAILPGNARDFSNGFQFVRGFSPDNRATPFATLFNLASILTTARLSPPAGAAVNAVDILELPAWPGCEAGGDMMGPYDHRLWSTTATNVASQYGCAWDYPAAAVMLQPLETLQAIGRATFRLNDAHQAYVEFMGSNAKANRIFEPNQISSSATATAVFNPSTWYPLN